MQAGVNRIIVEMPDGIWDEVASITKDPTGKDVTIFKDITFDRGEHILQEGIVRAIPKSLKYCETTGIFPINREAHEPWVRGQKNKSVGLDQIDPIVQVGDTVYFEYNVFDPSYGAVQQNQLFPDKNLFHFEYRQIVAIKRNDQIIPLGGRVIMSKVDEHTFAETTLIIPEAYRKKHKSIYRIEWMGEPFKCDNPTGLSVGDLAVIIPEFMQRIRIDLTDYFFCFQRDILLGIYQGK